MPLLKDLPREVGVLAAIAFCVALGFGIVALAIPVFAREFGVSAFLAGAVVSAFALMRLVSAPPAGAMVNRIGERRVLAAGLAIVALSSLAAAFSQSYWQLLVMRGVGGFGSSMFTVSAMALLLRTVGPDQRGRAAGAFQAGFLLGGIAGPAVGGLIVGISLRAPFVFYAATLAVATVVCLIWLKEPAPVVAAGAAADAPAAANPASAPAPGADDGATEPGLTLRAAVRMRAYRAALAANFANGFGIFGLRSALVPLFVVEGMRQGASLTGWGFLVAAVVQGALLLYAGRMTDRRGRRPALLIGSVTSLVGMVMLASSTQMWVFFAAMVVFGLSGAFLGPAPTAVIGDVTKGQPGGSVVAASQMVSDFGAIVGPLLAGLALDRSGFPAAFALGAAMMLPALITALVMPETLRRKAPEAAAGA